MNNLSAVWSQQIGSSGSQQANSIAVSPDGSIYICGNTNTSFDGQNYGGNQDGYLIKFNSSGVKQWTKFIATNSGDSANGVIVGADGYISVTGTTYGNLNGQINISNNQNAYVQIFSPEGLITSTYFIGVGNAYGISTIGNTSFICGSSGSQAFWAKGASTNTSVDVFQPFGPIGSNASASAITVNSDGSFYICGNENGTWYGISPIGGTVTTDAFIIKFSSNGSILWTQLFGSTQTDHATGVATSPDGSVYVCGYSDGSFDGQSNTDGVLKAFLTKFSPTGSKLWTKFVTDTGYLYANSIKIDIDGTILIVGTVAKISGQVVNGGTDGFISKFNSDGSQIFTQLLGSNSYDYINSVQISSSGSILLAGSTSGDFNGSINQGGDKAFLADYLTTTVTQLPTSAVQIARFAGALYGVEVGTVTMSQINADIYAVGGINAAVNAYYKASFGNFTATSVAAQMLANVGLSATDPIAVSLNASWTAQIIVAAATGTQGQTILALLSNFASNIADATYGKAALAFNNNVNTALTYTGTDDVKFGTANVSIPVFLEPYSYFNITPLYGGKNSAFSGWQVKDNLGSLGTTLKRFCRSKPHRHLHWSKWSRKVGLF